jgi:hypothetical protein
VAINALDTIDGWRGTLAPRRIPPSVLLVYDDEHATTGRAIAAEIGALPGRPEVWQAVDVSGGDATSQPSAVRSPAGAVGRFPKVHEFDQVVVLGQAAVPPAVGAAVRLLPPFDVAPLAALLPSR